MCKTLTWKLWAFEPTGLSFLKSFKENLETNIQNPSVAHLCNKPLSLNNDNGGPQCYILNLRPFPEW